LNSHGRDFKGGEFAIVSPSPNASGDGDASGTNVRYVVKPREGDVVIFYQERLNPPSDHPPYELQHEGSDVTEGEKFACRTMVDYVFPDRERARMGNVKDDAQRRATAVALGAGCSARGPQRVLAIGNTIIDMILTVPHIPIDEKIRVDTKQRYVGGQGANAAQAMAVLGLNVSFVSRIGDDADGGMARSAYQALGMDLTPIIVVPGAATSSAAVIVATGENKQRTILIYDDPALHAPRPAIAAALDDLARRVAAGEFSAVYTDGWQMDLALPIVRAAVAHKVPVVVDVEEITNETRALADLATILIANAPIIQALASSADDGDLRSAVASLAALRAGRTVVATIGPGGAYGAEHGSREVVHVPAVKCDVRDTTGAGDSFHAGYVDALVRGLSLREAITFATHVAAAKCETPGSAVTRASLELYGVLPRTCAA